jgi:hypothetical protein
MRRRQPRRSPGTGPPPRPRPPRASPHRQGTTRRPPSRPASRASAQDRCSCSRYLHRMATRVARLTTRSRRAAGSIRPRVNRSRPARRCARSAVHISILPTNTAPERSSRSTSRVTRARRSRTPGISRLTSTAALRAAACCSRSEARTRRLTISSAPAPTIATTASRTIGMASSRAVSGRTSARL